MEDSKQTRIRVAIKWAINERVTLEEFNLWVKMLQNAPVIETPNPDQIAASQGAALGVMEQYLRQNRGQ